MSSTSSVTTYRVFALSLAVLLPAYGYVFDPAQPQEIDPIWLRWVLSAWFLGLFGISFHANLRTYLPKVWKVTVWMVTAWYLSIVSLNDFSLQYAVGALVILPVGGGVLRVANCRLQTLWAYYGFGLLAVGLGVVNTDLPQQLEAAYIVSLGTVVVATYLIQHRQYHTATELEASRRKYKSLFEASNEAIVIHDLDGAIIDVNPRAEELFASKRDAFQELQIRSLFPPSEEHTIDQMMDPLGQGESSTREIQCAKADGTIFWGKVSLTPVELDDEICGRMMIRDVTRQRSLKKELQEERDLFSRVLETSPVAITIVDREGEITFANRQAENVLGVRRSEITNRTYDDPLWKLADARGDEDYREELPFVQVMDTGEPVYGVEHSIKGPDGDRRILSVNGAPFEEDDRIKNVVFAIEDITDRRAVRTALVQSQQRLQALFDNALDLILLADDEGEYVDVNPAAEHVLGYSRQELTDMNLWDLTPETGREEGRRAWDDFLASGQMEGEYEVRTREGKRLQMEFRAVANIQPGLHLSVMRDVTDRKQLEEQTDRFFSLSLDLLCIADTAGYFRRINPAFHEVFGYSEEELLGRRFVDFVHPEDQAATERVLDRLSDGQDVTKFVNRYSCKDGSCRWIEWDATPDPERELVYAVARDVTRRHEYEENLRSAKERAEEMNRLKSSFLANMSHEIRTPLTSIIGYADLLKTRLPEGEHSHVEHISQSGKRLLTTLNSVLDLAQLESGEMTVTPTTFDVLEEIRRIGDSLRIQIDENAVDLRFDLPPGPEWAHIDRGIFGRVVTNLIHNAAKFTYQGYVEVRCRVSGDEITIVVEDTGIGMEERFVDQLFEAFRQESSGLSRQFEGSGLGLTITKHLLELVGGRIAVESEKGEGSVFTVQMPRDWREAADRDERAGPSPPVQAPLPEDQRILVVDDDPAAAELISGMLSDTHVVDAAAGPDEALDLTAGQEYDVIFMDINLKARINGDELLEEMRAADAVGDATVIALTAYALPGDREKYLAKGFDGYLAKPFNRMILFDYLARIM